MDVRNCRTCGRLYNHINGPNMCQVCKGELEDKFQQVKKYINDNPGMPLVRISEENDVSVQQLKQWVREERLTFSDDSPIGIECENCGAVIKTGRFCVKCKEAMVNNLNSAIRKPEPVKEQIKKPERSKERMRFLDQDIYK